MEWKTLGEIAEVVRGDRITKAMLKEDGKYVAWSGGREPFGRYDDYNREANTIIVAQYGSAGYVNWVSERFWANDICYSVFPKESTNNRFLYYALLKKQNEIYDMTTKAIPDCLPKDKLLNVSIPVPPLAVQERLVKVLDNFDAICSDLGIGLPAEIEARQKQYEHYRDALLDYAATGRLATRERERESSALILLCQYVFGVVKVSLRDIASYARARVAASEVDEDTYVGVENLLQEKQGKTLASSVPATGSVIAFHKEDILIGNIRPYLRKIWFADCEGGTNGDVLAIHINDTRAVLPRFLFHVLASDRFFLYDTQNSKGAKMPRGNKESVMKYAFSLPSLAEQRRVVAILDRFDALCNDLSSGLPAEIAARQRQYEHYRDKLLSFPAAGNLQKS